MSRIAIGIMSDLSHETRLHRQVVELQTMGYDVTIMALRGGASQPLFAGVRVVELPLAPSGGGKRYFIRFMLGLYRRIRRELWDCFLAVDVPGLFPMALAKGRAALIYDSREFYTEMGTVTGRPLVRHLWKRLEQFGIRRASAWFTVCDSIAQDMQQLYGVQPGGVVRNLSPYQERSDIRDDYLRRCFHIPADQRILLYQGGFWSAYDFAPLNRAVASRHDVALVYVGDGPLLEVTRQQVQDLGAADRIHFHEKVPPADLPQITHSADIGTIIIPDRGLSYYYLLPNKLFEYIQARLPLLVSDFPEMNKVVLQYDIGTGVNPAQSNSISNGIDRLLAGLQQNRYGSGLDRAAQELAWKNDAQVFRELIAQWC